ncbi:probable splicing factor, arginine/serine-rich 7 [Phlebotomus argentipes]|uniref:probable splicing factor, arginine/serine-rich 7 n=1 Tax=Phlebotomus argentipes TaxID=94469 RepID=UPI00289338A4|nr:probable splicing factor, arginine/serine-rich 7 [Phlebotomus argentipes]
MAGGGTTTKVVQITNIAPQATKDQMQNLFGSIGKIDDLRLYPTIRDVSCPVVSRICYVKYQESSSVAVAQHMTNTVFIDRALIVIPVYSGLIPDEYKALEMSTSGTLVPGLQSAGSKLPPELVNRIDGVPPSQVIMTSDPKLDLHKLPPYPPLPVNFDARKIEETRRTIMVIDVCSDWTIEDLMEFFSRAGEVKYGRIAEVEYTRHAMIEFTEQKSIIEALKLHGVDFKGSPVSVYHSTQPITKPETKSNEAAQKEIEEAMCIVKEAQNMISAAIDPVIGMLSKDKSVPSRSRRSRSRSHERRHSRSRSRKRSSSRKRSKSRRRSRSHSRRSRSRSRSRSKRSRRRSRSKSKSSSSRSRKRESSRRSRSRERRRKSRSRHRSRSSSRSHRRSSRERKTSSRSHRREERRRSRSRSRSKRKESSRSSRRHHTPDSSKRSKDEKIQRDYDDEEKIGQPADEAPPPPPEPKQPAPPRTPSPEKSDNMDISP